MKPHTSLTKVITNMIKSLSLTSGRRRQVVSSLLTAIVSALMFASPAFAQDAVQPTFIQIDVVPGAVENRISLGTSYAVPVAILSNAGFDAASVNPETLTLSGGPVSKDDDEQLSTLRDVNEDGLQDMLVYFAADYTQLREGTTEAILQGNTNDGTPIRGTDYVQCSGSVPQQAKVTGASYTVGGFGFATIMANPAFVVGYVEAMYNYIASFFTPAPIATPMTVEVTPTPNATPISVPATGNTSGRSTPYPSTIVVSGVSASEKIKKVTVTLNNVSHAFPDDMDVLLVGPGGQKLLLMSDTGGPHDITGLTLTFDDSATISLPDNPSGAYVSGTYKPTNFGSGNEGFPSTTGLTGTYQVTPNNTLLSVFNGTDPNGTWSLYVVDDSNGDTGSITGGWSLKITTEPSDTTAPTLTLPGNMTVEATSASGAEVTYTASATDADPANPTVNCTPPSGSTFAITTTTVQCSATDTAGNTANGSFTVTVRDTTAPVISTTDITVNATSASGAVVTFSNTTATDTVDSTPTLTFSPVSGSTFPIGTTAVTVTAKDDYNNTANATFNVTVNKAAATVTLSNLAHIYDGSAKSATATTNPAGLNVTLAYAQGGTSVASPINVGSYGVTATINDASYQGSTTGTLVISKADQTISFGALGNKTFGNADFTVSATASSGLAVSFSVGATDQCTISGNTVHITGAGSCTVTASQSGNSNYNAAPDVSQSFTIAKAQATLILSSLSQTYDGSPKSATVMTNPTGLNGVSVTYDGSATAPTNAGSYAVVASLTNANYQATNATGTLEIAKANQTITFGALGNKTFGDPAFTVNATASSGLSVSFAAAGKCTVSGNTVSITGAGNCTITASQGGNGNYNAAADVLQSFTIAKAAATITLSNLTHTYDGTPKSATATTNPAGLSGVSITYDGSATAPSNASSYAVIASLANDNYEAPNATGTLVINKATPTVTITGGLGTFVYNGLARTATASITGVGGANLGAATITYNGGSAPPVNVGSYDVVASFAGNSNYNPASAAGNITITKASLTFTAEDKSKVYGQLNPSLTYTVSGFVNNETASTAYTGAPSLSTVAANSAVGMHPITIVQYTLSSGNYDFSFVPGKLTITKATLDVTADNQTITYGDSDPSSFTFQYGTFQNGDSASVIDTPPTCGVSGAHANAGSYTIVCSGGSDNNYDFHYVGGTLTVNKATLTVTAENKTRVYGADNPTFTVVFSDFKYEQTLATSGVTGSASCTTKATATSSVLNSPYPITCTEGTLTSSNYIFSFVAGNLSVTARPVVVKATDIPRTYGYLTPAFSIDLTGGTSLASSDTLASLGTPQFSPDLGDNFTDVGTHRINVSGLSNSNYQISYATGTNRGLLTIIKRQTRITLIAPSSGQFGDCLPVNAKLVDIGDGSTAAIAAATPIAGATLTLNIGSNSVNATTDGNGEVNIPIAVTNSVANNYTVGASYAGSDIRFGSMASQPFQVTTGYVGPLDNGGFAGVYTGETVFWTTSSTSSTATLTLSATIQDISSDCAGDIRRARVTFAIRNADGVTFTPINGATNLPVGLVDPTTPNLRVGTASAIVQYNMQSNANSDTLTIAVIVTGDYKLNAPNYDQVVTVAKPLSGQIIGAGGIDNTNSSGYLAGAGAPVYTKYGFGVKYNKSGTNPQGQATVTITSYNRPDGTRDTKLHMYLIKSNAIASLALTTTKTANFSSKASIIELVLDNLGQPTGATASVDGGATLQLAMTDGSPSLPDKLAITVQRKDGGLWFSSNWTGVPPKTTEKPVLISGITSTISVQ